MSKPDHPSLTLGRIAAIVPVTGIGRARDADFGLRCFVFADPEGNPIDVGEPT